MKTIEEHLIFVSHDRFFVNKIADSILSFENGTAKFYPYGYEYYLEKRVEDVKVQVKEEKQEKAKKQVYINPQKEIEKLERKIQKLEEQISQKEEEISNFQNELTKEEIYSDYVKVGEINEKIDTLKKEVEDSLNTWEEYQENVEKIKSEM